jgi:hypothetical protein
VLALAGGRPTRREQTAVVAALLGLILLGLSLTGASGGGAASPLALGLWLGASAAVAALAAGPLRTALLPGPGSAAGVLYATADVATKEARAADPAWRSCRSRSARAASLSSPSSSHSSEEDVSRRPGSRLSGRTRCRSSRGAWSSTRGFRPARPGQPAPPRSASWLPAGQSWPAPDGDQGPAGPDGGGAGTRSVSSLTDESIPGRRRADRDRWQRPSRAARPECRSR